MFRYNVFVEIKPKKILCFRILLEYFLVYFFSPRLLKTYKQPCDFWWSYLSFLRVWFISKDNSWQGSFKVDHEAVLSDHIILREVPFNHIFFSCCAFFHSFKNHQTHFQFVKAVGRDLIRIFFPWSHPSINVFFYFSSILINQNIFYTLLFLSIAFFIVFLALQVS